MLWRRLQSIPLAGVQKKSAHPSFRPCCDFFLRNSSPDLTQNFKLRKTAAVTFCNRYSGRQSARLVNSQDEKKGLQDTVERKFEKCKKKMGHRAFHSTNHRVGRYQVSVTSRCLSHSKHIPSIRDPLPSSDSSSAG